MQRSPVKKSMVFCHGLGGFGSNLLYAFIGSYLIFFFTDVMGLSGTVAGSIFMVSRILDAITDPIMGMIVDRTNTKRFGKYRPYFLFAAPLMGTIFVMLFTVPNMPLENKVLYGYIMYILYSMAFTAVQTPFLALPVLFSNNVNKRTKLMAISQALSTTGTISANILILPLLKATGGQTNPRAWTTTSLIFAAIFVTFTYVMAFALRKLDVYQPPEKGMEEKQKISIRTQLKAIYKNPAILMLLIGFGTDQVANQVGNSLNMYFFEYNMGGKTGLITYVGIASLLSMILIVTFIGRFSVFFGKKRGIIIVECVSICFSLMLFFVPKTSVPLVMIAVIGSTFALAVNNMLTRSAVLDAANYAEWKLGVKANALVSSTFTFVNKLSQAFGAFSLGIVLDKIGYVAQAETQTASVLSGLLNMKVFFPVVAYAITIVAMLFYPLSRKGEVQMSEEMMAKYNEGQGTAEPDVVISE